MNFFIHRSNIPLVYPWWDWAAKDLIETHRITNSPFILYVHKDWKVKKNAIITVIWEKCGQIFIKQVIDKQPNQKDEISQQNVLNREIQILSSLADKKLTWSHPRSVMINGMKALNSFTTGEVIINNHFELYGRISLYIITCKGFHLPIIIAGAYGAHKYWGNREVILREAIWEYMEGSEDDKNYIKIPITADIDYEHLQKLDLETKKTTAPVTPDNDLAEILQKINELNEKLDAIRGNVNKRFNEIEDWLLDINDRIDSTKSEILTSFGGFISNIVVKEEKDKGEEKEKKKERK